MADTLGQFGYGRCKHADKGVLRQYLRKLTGLSRARVARCIKQFTTGGGQIKGRRRPPAVPFARRYSAEDIRLLAEMDVLHGTLSGTTIRKLCERTFKVHGDASYGRLAGIGIKGVYLINAVDETTQFQTVFAVEHISEAYLLPVLAAMMDAFPFVIRGFHSDNGSEYTNRRVAALLEKLLFEQTKSCSRQTNENKVSVRANLQVMPELQCAGRKQERAA